MIPAFETTHVKVYQGDALTVLRELPDASVNCVVTSPPYWGLRDYGVAGQLGLEPTPDAYVAKMVEVFREVRRVLANHGTLWLNLGDSYTSGGRDYRDPGQSKMNGGGRVTGLTARGTRAMTPPGLKPKDMVGIPWRVAFALRADGWYLRSDIIWAKPNPMPESVTDRPTKAHEYVFLLSKRERYFYDAAAIRTPFAEETKALSFETMDFGRRDDYKAGRKIKMPDGWDTGSGGHGSFHRNGREKGATVRRTDKQRGHSRRHDGFNDRWDAMEKSEQQVNGANARTVWEIATQPYPEAHFATFPRELPERCIKAGCPEQVCATCGKARERIIAATYANPGNRKSNGRRDGEGFRETGVRVMASGKRLERQVTTTGWTDCGHGNYRAGAVLDPFAGSGTTLAVARDLGRKSIGIELSPEYVRLIEKRCAQLAMDMVVGE